jgi:arylsulfatase A-like enzyme
MTGKYPARLGLTDHTGGPQPAGWNRPSKLKPAQFINWLPLQEQTLAETLHDNGYATFFAGKWHLGHSDNFWPEYQGFDVNIGGWAQGGPFGGKQYFPPYGNPRLADGPTGEHLPDRLADETVRFIESHRHKPFLAFLSFYSVHVPLSAREDLRQKYEQKRNPFPDPQTPTFQFDGETRVRQNHDHAVYAAMVDAMDQAVGKVMASVDRLGLADRTLVIFTSDNGGLSTGDRGISQDQGWPTSNVPLRMGKGWLYEGGIRVPLVVKMPTARAGITSDSLVTSTDYVPTILELTGLSDKSMSSPDGISFAPALRDMEYDRGPIYWHYPHYSNQGGPPGCAVRDDQWKLIHWFEDDRVELFNLREDIGEHNDLSRTETKITKRLEDQLHAWLSEVQAKLPTPHQK